MPSKSPSSKSLQPARTRILVATLLGAALFCQSHAAEKSINISGFQIDPGRASKSEVKETLATLEHQIRIVESAGLQSQVLSFFRGVPILIDPSLTGMNGQYAQVGGKWLVRARAGAWPPDRAILLHELLHAYHQQVLGQPTPPLGRAFQESQRDGVYPPEYRDAYFLSNAREYFAVIAEIYLAGPSFRPPYNCANVRKAQPQFISYLASLFGERECTSCSGLWIPGQTLAYSQPPLRSSIGKVRMNASTACIWPS